MKGTSIERIIALGMGMNGSTKIERERKTLFRRAWYAYHNNKSDVGYAENRIGKSHGCHFPRSFSRYSTLESDRGNVEAAARDLLSKESSGGEGEGKGGKAAAHTSDTIPASPKDGGGPITDEIRYLVLCRVAVGKVFVTSKEYKGFPSVGNDPTFDSCTTHCKKSTWCSAPSRCSPSSSFSMSSRSCPAALSAPSLPGHRTVACPQAPRLPLSPVTLLQVYR